MTLQLLVCFVLVSTAASEQSGWRNIPNAIWLRTRRTLNLSSTFGSPATSSRTPYDRIAGQPVFQVTTPFGAPYMNFEQVENQKELAAKRRAASQETGYVAGSEDVSTRPVALFFLDPDEALRQHQSLKQMEHMKGTDLRITTTTLAKALRQSSNYGNGLVTGTQPDPLTGRLKSSEEGGSLRYKIVMPLRQLYYAARCEGRERVGLFGATAEDDAFTAARHLDEMKVQKIEERRDLNDNKKFKFTPEQAKCAHMISHTGIPVFYAPEMRKQQPRIKQLTSGVRQEMPFFFNYEDMMDAWQTMRKRNRKATNIPAKPTKVEVFNLWDVLTSIDREEGKNKGNWRKDPLKFIRKRFIADKEPDLDSIVFIPSSRAIKFKEQMAGKGNGKARLRPMR